MRPSSSDLRPLRTVARHLGALRDELVFLGGAVIPLLLSDSAAPPARPTDDVDLIVQLASRAEYPALQRRLTALGFREDTRPGAPLCRWIVEGITVDVMPTDAAIYGYSNKWYAHAIATAARTTLADDDGFSVRIVSAPSFVTTKFEAFASRGNGEWHVSHDIEDVIAVIDGRPELVREVEHEPPALRTYIAEQLSALISAGVDDILRSHLPADLSSDARLPLVTRTVERLAASPSVSAT